MAHFDVEGQRQGVKNILILAAVCVVVPHVDEEGLLVVEVLVEFQPVVDFLHLPLADLKFVLQVSCLLILIWVLLLLDKELDHLAVMPLLGRLLDFVRDLQLATIDYRDQVLEVLFELFVGLEVLV